MGCFFFELKRAIIIAHLLWSIALYSQENSALFLSIKVVDSIEKSPLTFVSVNEEFSNTVLGWTDFEGKVLITDVSIGETLIFTHIGYEKTIYTVEKGVSHVIIEMHQNAHLLREFEVRSQKDKSLSLMQKVVDNFDRNNPLNRNDFSCEMYNKMLFDFDARDSIDSDSVQLRIDRITRGGHLMLLESVVEFRHDESGLTEEKVIASKVSGFEKPEFALLASDFQPFGFYEKRLTLLDLDYLNPISQAGLNKYKFQIADTLIDGLDSVFILKFKPKSYGVDRLLKGTLYIHSKDYALQNVSASASQPGLVDFKLEQVFYEIIGRGWFPKELNFEIHFKEYPNEKIVAFGKSRSTVRHVLFEPLDRSDINVISINLSTDAYKRDSIYWDSKRNIPLSEREQITYINMDSLAHKLKFHYINRLSQSIAALRIPVGFLDIDMSQTLKVNRFENIRFGTGLYTNSTISSYFSFGGHLGFGLRDHEWKYGGALSVFPRLGMLNRIKFEYNNDIRESGDSDNTFELYDQFEFRDVLVNRMERYVGWSADFHSTKIRYTDINLGAVWERVVPLFNYEFLPLNSSNTTYFNYAIDVQINYNFKSKLYKLGNHVIREASKHPQFKLVYRKGFSLDGRGFNYHRLFAEMKAEAYFFGTLKSSLTMNGGFINRSVPLGFLFNSFGSNTLKFSVFMPDYFQTMPLNEYLADRFFTVFTKQEVIHQLYKSKISSPSVALWHAIGYGSLQNATFHSGITFRTLQNGYFETGLILDEIVKYKYLNLVYCNLGGGVFYGYGFNAYSTTVGAPAFRLSISAAFR